MTSRFQGKVLILFAQSDITLILLERWGNLLAINGMKLAALHKNPSRSRNTE